MRDLPIESFIVLGHTVHDVTVLDLLQDLGPDIGMAFLVCGHGRGLEVDDLSNTANLRHFVCCL